jgi:hypothetical protein
MWLDHCVSTPCDSITAAVPRWISRFFALLDGYVSSSCGSITAVPRWIPALRGTNGAFVLGKGVSTSPILRGATPAFALLDHCVLTPCGSITAAIGFISALSPHCGSLPCSITEFHRHVAQSLQFLAGSP